MPLSLLEKDFMKLSHKESVIIRLRFGIGTDDPMTYEEIAEVIGISKTMVKVLEHRALRKLKHISNRPKMKDIQETFELIGSSDN
jgi:RNA polymerase sigma factor (sigma-70 family)